MFARDPLRAKCAGGKTGMVKEKKDGKKVVIYQRPKSVTSDMNGPSEWRVRMLTAKFSQDELAKRVLLATGRAQLTHWTRGKPVVVEHDLMKVRGLV